MNHIENIPQLKSLRVKTALQWAAAVSFSVTITFFFLFLEYQTPSPEIFLRGSAMAFLATVILAVVYFGWTRIDEKIWPLFWRHRFKCPDIAVLRLEGAKPLASNYHPADWLDWFKAQSLRARYIEPSGSFRGVDILINPYGEGYPEENALRLKSFERIEEFVFNGGVFVSIGGYAFFYALDAYSKEPIPLAPLSLRYKGEIKGQDLNIWSVIRRGEKNLAQGTILATRFKLLTTLEASETVQTRQDPADIEFAGNLTESGGSDSIEQFRAIQAPAPVSHPILRATSQQFGEIYPLLALRYGRGFFIIGGMLLNVQPPKDVLSRSAFEKSCRAVANVAQRIADGRIEAQTV